MLKICIHPEPKNFDADIRQLGNAWLLNHPNALPKKYPPHWTRCVNDLHNLYKGICCYYGIYIEPSLGGASVDHYLPKSKYPQLTYEWSNFRYACINANRRKRDYEDVIDPKDLLENTFMLDLGNGEIYYNNTFCAKYNKLLDSTIERLELNSPDLCQARLDHIRSYFEGEITEKGLKARSPFVYSEVVRQNML